MWRLLKLKWISKAEQSSFHMMHCSGLSTLAAFWSSFTFVRVFDVRFHFNKCNNSDRLREMCWWCHLPHFFFTESLLFFSLAHLLKHNLLKQLVESHKSHFVCMLCTCWLDFGHILDMMFTWNIRIPVVRVPVYRTLTVSRFLIICV